MCSNVCQGHNRFRDEILRANEHGIEIIILCEHGKGIERLEDVIWWDNPRRIERYKDLHTGKWLQRETKALTGEKLYKILSTFQRKYGCRFLFCNKEETGRRIIELLEVNWVTVEEIKATYSMRDIVERYGFHPTRAGFIPCPFHSGDRQPSLKVYDRDFHCHACNTHGDIFDFVMLMDEVDFKTAFQGLGGEYQKPSFSSRM